MEREKEREIAAEMEIEIETEREKGDFDSSNSPGHELSANHVSVFLEDIGQKGKTSTIAPDFSLSFGVTLERCPLQSMLPNGR